MPETSIEPKKSSGGDRQERKLLTFRPERRDERVVDRLVRPLPGKTGERTFDFGLNLGVGLITNSGQPLTALARHPVYENGGEIPEGPRGSGFETVDGVLDCVTATAGLDYGPSSGVSVAHYDLGRTYMALRRYTSAVRAYLGARDAYLRLNALAADQRAAFRAREQGNRVRSNSAWAERAQATGDRTPVALRERENRAQESGGPRWTPEEPPAELWLALGSAYLRLGRHDDAERQYRAAIAANPALGEAHNNLGVLCLMKGQLDEAARELALAERAGYRVSAGLKADLAARRR